MKRLVYGIIITLTFFVCAPVGSAAILAEDVAINGIHIKMSSEEVKNICGAPSRLENEASWFYGKNDEMNIRFYYQAEKPRVQSVLLKMDNGMTTPSGIRVGSLESDVLQIHGEPDNEEMPDPIFAGRYGTDYDYILWYYRADFQGEGLCFGIKDGVVVFIECTKVVR